MQAFVRPFFKVLHDALRTDAESERCRLFHHEAEETIVGVSLFVGQEIKHKWQHHSKDEHMQCDNLEKRPWRYCKRAIHVTSISIH